MIVERNLAWSYCQHDCTSARGDPQMSITRSLLEYALARNVEILSYTQFYERRLAERGNEVNHV